MSDVRELYQEIVLEHNAKPRNFGELPCATHHARGHNPLCGDQYKIALHVNENGIIEHVRFSGNGCAISKASASMMTTAIKGQPVEYAKELFEAFRALVTDDEAPESPILGELKVFAGVRAYPMRVKCATLAWHAVHAALNNQISISTE